MAHTVFPIDSADLDNSFKKLYCKGKGKYGEVTGGRGRIRSGGLVFLINNFSS